MRGIPFWLRLLAAFAAVTALAVGSVAILVSRSASAELDIYANRNRLYRARALAPLFVAHYEQSGGWQSAGEVDELRDLAVAGQPPPHVGAPTS